jgi:hypothetical protein
MTDSLAIWADDVMVMHLIRIRGIVVFYTHEICLARTDEAGHSQQKDA